MSSNCNRSTWSSKLYLQKYYRELFPWNEIYRWFCYRDVLSFGRREFAFTYRHADSFIRYKMFETDIHLANFLRRSAPVKIDVGAYYNVSPDNIKDLEDWKVTEKELIFDIDLNDYNDVRKCCQDRKVCRYCWKFAAIACKILDAVLREDYGWKLILWVFSGRRGIHCWVCDESARKMTDEQRQQFLSFICVTVINSEQRGKTFINSKRLNNHIRRSFAIAKGAFLRVCLQEQDILGTDERVAIFLELLTEECREEVKKIILNVTPGVKRWMKFNEYWTIQKSLKSNVWQERPHLIVEIVLWYLYPRIDVNVTNRMDHLLKAPFSPHPATEAICIPFDPRKVDEFDIDDVPRLGDLVEASITMKNSKNGKSLIESSQLTSYRRSIKVFENFVNEVEKALIQRSVRLPALTMKPIFTSSSPLSLVFSLPGLLPSVYLHMRVEIKRLTDGSRQRSGLIVTYSADFDVQSRNE